MSSFFLNLSFALLWVYFNSDPLKRYQFDFSLSCLINWMQQLLSIEFSFHQTLTFLFRGVPLRYFRIVESYILWVSYFLTGMIDVRFFFWRNQCLVDGSDWTSPQSHWNVHRILAVLFGLPFYSFSTITFVVFRNFLSIIVDAENFIRYFSRYGILN